MVRPCKVEIPDLIELQSEFSDQLVVVGIDVLDEWTRVKPFADNLKVNYPLLDANNRKDVEDAFGPMWGLPTSVIIGRTARWRSAIQASPPKNSSSSTSSRCCSMMPVC